MIEDATRPDDTLVEPSGWFAVQLRYAYLAGDAERVTLVEDRVVLVDGADEEAALGRAIEMAPEYEDDYETDSGEPGTIRAGIREGIEAVLLGLAAEASKRTGLPVDVGKLRADVFGAER